MIRPAFSRRCEWTLAALVTCGLVASCAGSSGSSSQHPLTTRTSTHATTHASTNTNTAPPAHHDPYPALCRKIAPAHVQALYRRPLAPMQLGGSSDCSFKPTGSTSDSDSLKVYLRIKDADKMLFNHIGDIDYGTFTAMDGLGGPAKWARRPGSPPTAVDVRRGSFSCTVIPPADLGVMRITTVGGTSVAVPAAAAYARLAARICTDVLAGR